MKKVLLLSFFMIGFLTLFAQQKNTSQQIKANAYTKSIKSIISNMPVSTSSEATKTKLKTLTKEQELALEEIHLNMVFYVEQIRQKYGSNTQEVRQEIEYQKSYYFRQLKKLLNTHQYAYLNSIHQAKDKDLIDIVDLSVASQKEITAARENLARLQSINFINFSEL